VTTGPPLVGEAHGDAVGLLLDEPRVARVAAKRNEAAVGVPPVTGIDVPTPLTSLRTALVWAANTEGLSAVEMGRSATVSRVDGAQPGGVNAGWFAGKVVSPKRAVVTEA